MELLRSVALARMSFFFLHFFEFFYSILLAIYSKLHVYITLRAVCCKNRLRVCKIEKSDFLKICQNKGFGELVLKI